MPASLKNEPNPNPQECQLCGRHIRTLNDLVVRHGWSRTGGECAGTGYLPYDQDIQALRGVQPTRDSSEGQRLLAWRYRGLERVQSVPSLPTLQRRSFTGLQFSAALFARGDAKSLTPLGQDVFEWLLEQTHAAVVMTPDPVSWSKAELHFAWDIDAVMFKLAWSDEGPIVPSPYYSRPSARLVDHAS